MLGVIVALITLTKALFEYTQQGRQKRSEHFFELRSRMKGSPEFEHISELLDMASAGDTTGLAAREQLKEVPFQIKRDYLGLFEEIAIAMNSRLIKPQVAHYMFGYYALLCWNSDEFWSGVNRDAVYWSLFNDFCEQMESEHETFIFKRNYIQAEQTPILR